MSALVDLRRDREVAVIVIDNPPVNALKNEVRAGLVEMLAQARGDAAIEAIVITCAGRTFVAGADISEFGKPVKSPTTIDVITAIEGMGKPVIAAMHGTALGGGLEVALGCHFRIAMPGTRLGQPEIKLGLIPGAGGTQRLPRLIGIDKALAMILTGDPIAAAEALQLGLVDEIVPGDLTQGAVAFARRIVGERRPLVLARDRQEKIEAFAGGRERFDDLAATYVKRGRGLDAPIAAIEAVRWALELPVEQALARERERFMQLMAGEQSKAQRHIFFAQREAAKVPDLAAAQPRDITRAAVIGAGTMGSGIAMSLANAGIPVTLVELSQQALARGLDAIVKTYQTSAARGGLSPDDMARRIGSIAGTTDVAAIAGADLVIEAVFEDLDVKTRVFSDLDRLAKGSAVLATNTSYLDVDTIAQATRRPADVLGLHFFSPANVMRLVEVVRGAATAPDVLATGIALARAIGKVPVVVGVCHGFVGNRMLQLRSVEAERLLLEGALPRDVDAAMTHFGFPMGPFAAGDLAGLDVGWRMRQARGLRAEIADRLCELGRFGQKTGKGFYVYGPGARTPRPDDEVERLIVAVSATLGIKRRAIDGKEIVERLVLPMINEGARILDEGIARRAGDIDVIWVYGYGFPIWRGGPMHYADSIGLGYVRDRLMHYAAQIGDERHRPASLLARLAAEDRSFASLEL